jgi:hypothetical protein
MIADTISAGPMHQQRSWDMEPSQHKPALFMKWFWLWIVRLALPILGFLWLFPLSSAQGKVNITRSDYDQALIEWRSQGIEEYQIEVVYTQKGCGLAEPIICGTWTLKVRGDEIEIIGYKWINDQITRDPSVMPEDLRFLTVDGLFVEVNRLLRDGPFTYSRDIFLDYDVQFDPQMGYPTAINRYGRAASGTPTSSMVWHLGDYRQVKSFMVLKQKH